MPEIAASLRCTAPSLEDPLLLADPEDVDGGEMLPENGAVLGVIDPDQAIRLGVRQGCQQYPIDDGEHGRRRPEAQPEHQDRRHRERRAGAKAPQSGADVRHQVVERPSASGIADVFLDPLHSAESDQGLASRRGAVDAGADPLFHFPVEMEPKLFVELSLLAAATEHCLQAFG